MAMGSTNNGTSSTGTASGGMASAMGTSTSNATASGGPSSNGNGGGNGGSSAAGTNAGTGAGSAANNAAAGSTGDSKQNGATNAQSGSVMGGLQSAVSAARDARNSNLSGIQQGIAQAVSKTFGGTTTSAPQDGTRAPNATPGQRAAYNAGYRNETNAGMTRSAFGAVPGVGSLVGEGIARTAMSEPGGLADNERSAYATGVTGAKDAGVSTSARSLASTLGGVLGGPIGSALASLALGGFAYSNQRAANPQAFAGDGMTQSQGPVTGSMAAAMTSGNAGDGTLVASNPAQAGDAIGNYGLASDYGDAYRSYQNLNLGIL